MSKEFSPPLITFAVGVPTLVFQEANMTYFAKPETNYPTRVLAKALCLEVLSNNWLVREGGMPGCDYAHSCVNTLTLRTSLAVFASFKAWWEANHSCFPKFGSTETSPNWLDDVLSVIDLKCLKNWIRSHLDLWSGNEKEECYDQVYEAKLPDATGNQGGQEKYFMDSNFTGSTSDFVGGVPPSVFEEANMKYFNGFRDTVNYPSRVIAKALMLEMFHGNDLVAHHFDFTDCRGFVVSRELVERFLTPHTSFATLACVEAWWKSTHEDVADFRLNARPIDWLKEVVDTIETDWIRWMLEDELMYLDDAKSRYDIIYHDIWPPPNQTPKTNAAATQAISEKDTKGSSEDDMCIDEMDIEIIDEFE